MFNKQDQFYHSMAQPSNVWQAGPILSLHGLKLFEHLANSINSIIPWLNIVMYDKQDKFCHPMTQHCNV